MITVSINEAKNRLHELARLVQAGEKVTVTRNGKPVMDIVAHPPERKGGLNLDAIKEFKRKHGIDSIFGRVADDFDEPLPEDILIRPLPES